MILLADGHTNRGDDPVDVAHEAADRGVEISTIGLGSSIDENELREIAGTTGGDFYQVEDADDLPDTFERVAENQTGVELTDTNDDGIPDVVAEMDLSMPAGEPGVVGEPLELDPIALDTSGDGLLDNETVEINYRVHEENNETKLTAQVTYAAHHPARTDTTGDGLTDHEQIEGWEIEVVDDPDEAQDLEELVTDPESNGDPLAYFSPRTVYANPLVDDTTGNGVSDLEERELGTDPEAIDTTGDGISDVDAFDDPEEDPTVFSTSPPEATLLHYEQWSELGSVDVELSRQPIEAESPSWNFEYTVRLEDPTGVDSYEIERGGRTVGADDAVGGYTTTTRTETLDSLTEGAFAALRGSDTTIETSDIYGNDGSERLYSQSSFYGEVIGENVDPYTGGVLSGFTHSAAESPEMVITIGRALYDDPLGAGENFVGLLDEVDQETLEQAIPMIIEATREQQRLDNPHSEFDGSCDGDVDYEAYAGGWYDGYALHFLMSMAYGGTITKGASESSTVGQRMGRVADDVPPVRADGSGLKTARIANQLADEGYDSLAAQFRTAGKEAQAIKPLRDVDTAVFRSLDETQRTELLQHIANHPNGARLVNDLGPQRTDQLLSLSVRQTDNVQLRENLFRLHRQGVSSDEIDRFVRNVDELQGTSGLSDVVESVARGGGKKNFRGAAAEADVAATIKRSDTRQIEQLSRDISVDGVGSSELDLVLRDGTTIEIKSGDLKLDPTQGGAQQRQFNRLANQLTVHEQYRSVNNQGGNGYVIVRGETNERIDQLISDRGLQRTTVEELI